MAKKLSPKELVEFKELRAETLELHRNSGGDERYAAGNRETMRAVNDPAERLFARPRRLAGDS